MSQNSNLEHGNTEKPKKKIPTAIYFILGHEFCERFTFYGLQTLLSLYLISELHYSETMSTTIFHIWKSLAYFTPVLGAILADSWFGKFRAIFYVSLLYAFGNILIFVGSIKQKLNIMKALFLTGLVVVSIGTGGIKPCVSAFGGDQYDTNQEENRKYFFSMLYFLINVGSLLSKLVSPILRANVKCFGSDSCYPLAFAVPAILMIASIIVFVAGKSYYRTRKVEKNVLLLFFGCIFFALTQKVKAKKRDKEHWLDYAEDEYGEEFIRDAKLVLRVWFIMMPLPVFWALFDQTASRWTLQAMKLDGNIGFLKILPEQMQNVTLIFILTLIPFFDYVIYPCFSKFNLLKLPFHRIICGGMFASFSFVAAGFLEIGVENYASTLPVKEVNEDSIKSNILRTVNFEINSSEYQKAFQARKKNLNQFADYSFKVVAIQEENHTRIKQYPAESELFSFTTNELKLKTINDNENISDDEYKIWKFVLSCNNKTSNKLSHKKSLNYSVDFTIYLRLNSFENRYKNRIRIYFSKCENKYNDIMTLKEVEDNEMRFLQNLSNFTKTKIPILYQIPQYFILTCGEIMFSITGLHFSYSQAPLSMKSVMQASWLLTTAFGNLITIIVANSHLFQRQSWEFFAFAVLMALDITIFGILTCFYEYTTVTENQKSEKPK